MNRHRSNSLNALNHELRIMTKTDKIIVRGLVVGFIAGLAVILIIDLTQTLRVMAIIGAWVYLLFAGMHLMLGFPLFAIVQFTSDWVKDKYIMEKIMARSEIIHGIILVLSSTITCSVVYVLIPIGLAMMYNGDLDFRRAVETIIHLIRN